MADLFARIELGGFPKEVVYEEMHKFMASLNWHQERGRYILPHATYCATFNDEKPNITGIATMLKAGIHSRVWPSAVVLVIQAVDWAQSGTR